MLGCNAEFKAPSAAMDALTQSRSPQPYGKADVDDERPEVVEANEGDVMFA